jgi:Icc-related predicted phosphoesterase
VRILAIADAVSPFVYSENFPGNLPPFDLILSAGDMPGHVLEFLATKTRVQPIYVLGNHANGYLRSADDLVGEESPRLPGGCINAHLRVVEVAGLRIAGIEGSARYRPGPHQYGEAQMEAFALRLAPRLLAGRLRDGRALDVLLTHAPPKGPHEGEDRPHRGVPAFNRIHRWWRPRLHVHGHVHLNGANAPREYVSPEGVRVVNAYGFALIELDPDGRPTGAARPTR